jgi:ankyrin repeat protein
MLDKQSKNFNTDNLKNLFALLGSIIMGEIEMIRQMLNKGVDVNARLQDFSLKMLDLDSSIAKISVSDTPLMVALKYRVDFEIIKILFENGADINLTDQNGKTSVQIASESRLANVLELFNVKNG